MTSKTISDAVTNISAEYIEKAADYTVTKKEIRSERHGNRKWAIVAALVAVLMLAGFTIAPLIIEMINGRVVEWDENHLFSSGTANSMAEVRDGRVYFTLNNSDITEYCSETTYFRYDFTDEQDIVHVFLVGGEIDSIGWTEILFLEDGRRLSHSDFITEDENPPAWYITGNAEVNEDYGYVPPTSDHKHSYEFEIEVEEIEE